MYGIDVTLHTFFSDDYASAKEKYYGILNENAQVTGKLALAGKPSAITPTIRIGRVAGRDKVVSEQ